MWQFVEAILGLVEGCKELGTPVTGGNVSFYNQTGDTAILPTPTVGVLGVIDDVTKRTDMAFAEAGDEIWLLGETREELSGSVWADVLHEGHLGGMPPTIDFGHEKRLAAVLVQGAAEDLFRSAHDLADGGLAQALVESSLRRGFGAELELPGGDATVQLFSESTGRVLLSVAKEKASTLRSVAQEHRLPLHRLGTVTDEGDEAALTVKELFTIPLTELREAWSATLPAAMQV